MGRKQNVEHGIAGREKGNTHDKIAFTALGERDELRTDCRVATIMHGKLQAKIYCVHGGACVFFLLCTGLSVVVRWWCIIG